MMKRLAFFAFAVFMAPAQLVGQPMHSTESTPDGRSPVETRAEQVVDLINGEVAPEVLFSADFLAAIPPAQLRTFNANLTAQLGSAIEVALLAPRDGARAALEIRFERGVAKGQIGIDPGQGNLINLLHFTSLDQLKLTDDTPDKIAADLAALPGNVNAWFGPLDGGAPVISVGAESSLALGSTFKLYVLAALAEDIRAGKRAWNDVAVITEESYPSGMLHNWPKGAPVTLYTLAGLMISISDNTATDQLIVILGRDRVARLMRDTGHANPAANIPFLTTREAFMLKDCESACINAWRQGDAAARSALLDVLGREIKTLDEINANFVNGPHALDIEWFAAPSDLARLLAHMRRTADPRVFEIMAINPAAPPAIRANWDYVGFKGGSEPGVMNLTWLLRDGAGRDHVLTLGWNNAEAVLDEGRLDVIAQRILLLPR
jgi:beta-lactamase class A